MNNYVIIDADKLKLRIEELEKDNKELAYSDEANPYGLGYIAGEIRELKQVLSQSTPLIPEIEKAYTKAFSEGIVFGMHTEYKYKTSQDYIANLKLDI